MSLIEIDIERVISAIIPLFSKADNTSNNAYNISKKLYGELPSDFSYKNKISTFSENVLEIKSDLNKIKIYFVGR